MPLQHAREYTVVTDHDLEIHCRRVVADGTFPTLMPVDTAQCPFF